jgi:hypothetical protein
MRYALLGLSDVTTQVRVFLLEVSIIAPNVAWRRHRKQWKHGWLS